MCVCGGGGGGQGEDQEKILLCKGCHYMKNKNSYVCVMFFFVLSSHHDTNPLLHLYHFRNKI